MLPDYDFLQSIKYSLKSKMQADCAVYKDPSSILGYIPLYSDFAKGVPLATSIDFYHYDKSNGYLVGSKGTRLTLNSDDLLVEVRYDNTHYQSEEDILINYGGWPKLPAKAMGDWMKKGGHSFKDLYDKLKMILVLNKSGKINCSKLCAGLKGGVYEV